VVSSIGRGVKETCPWCRREIKHTSYIVFETDEYSVHVNRHQRRIQVYQKDAAGRCHFHGVHQMDALRVAKSVLGMLFIGAKAVHVSNVHSTFFNSVNKDVLPDILYRTTLVNPTLETLSVALQVFSASASISWRQFVLLDEHLKKSTMFIYLTRRDQMLNARAWMAFAFRHTAQELNVEQTGKLQSIIAATYDSSYTHNHD
jgi:hypothetical protein